MCFSKVVQPLLSLRLLLFVYSYLVRSSCCMRSSVLNENVRANGIDALRRRGQVALTRLAAKFAILQKQFIGWLKNKLVKHNFDEIRSAQADGLTRSEHVPQIQSHFNVGTAGHALHIVRYTLVQGLFGRECKIVHAIAATGRTGPIDPTWRPGKVVPMWTCAVVELQSFGI